MYKKKENYFIILFVSPKCEHEKLTNFIVGMNINYKRKYEDDCNKGGLFHSCLLIVHLPAQLVAIK